MKDLSVIETGNVPGDQTPPETLWPHYIDPERRQPNRFATQDPPLQPLRIIFNQF